MHTIPCVYLHIPTYKHTDNSPRAMTRSPRGDQLDNAAGSKQRSPRRAGGGGESKEVIRYEKEYVEVKVEVDRIPSEHLNKHQVCKCV